MNKNKYDWPVSTDVNVNYDKLWRIINPAIKRINNIAAYSIIDLRNYYFGYLSSLYKHTNVITKTEYGLLSYLFYYTSDEPIFCELTFALNEEDKHHFFWQCHMALRDYRKNFIYE